MAARPACDADPVRRPRVRFGATGILNALDAGNGAMLWSRNAGAELATKVPGWGFAGSPLVLGT